MKTTNLIATNGLVELHNGQVVTTSLLIAEQFNRNHGHILRDIRELDCSLQFKQQHFVPDTYVDAQSKKRPIYYIIRDGFTFLAFGFTGETAARFKEQYIAAFNKMEQQLAIMQTQKQQNASELSEVFGQLLSDTYALPHPKYHPKTFVRMVLQNMIEGNRQRWSAYFTKCLSKGTNTHPTDIARQLGWDKKKADSFFTGRNVYSIDDLIMFCDACGFDFALINKEGETLLGIDDEGEEEGYDD